MLNRIIARIDMQLNQLQTFLSTISSFYGKDCKIVRGDSGETYTITLDGNSVAQIVYVHNDYKVWLSFYDIPKEKAEKILQVIMQPSFAAESFQRFEEIQQEQEDTKTVNAADDVPF